MDTRNIAALAVTLPSELEIVMTRAFDAEPRLIFDAWTKPEHFKHWFGCRHNTLLACDIDLRVGGAYRFVMVGEDGARHAIQGVYREIVAPSRLVFTQVWSTGGLVSGEALVTLTFEERVDRRSLPAGSSTSRARTGTSILPPAWRRAGPRPSNGSTSTWQAVA